MKNITKKLFILTATVIMLCIISVVASAKTYGVLTYKSYGNEIVITDCENSATEVEIPVKIDGIPVTAISDFVFSGCTQLEKISIADNVTSISSYSGIEITAYYKNEDNWIDGVLYAGNHLIAVDKSKINGRVILKDGTKTLIDRAFSDCNGLESIVIPEGVTTIPSECFYRCEFLQTIIIPESVTVCKRNSFYSLNDANGNKRAIYYYGTENQWKEIECNTTGLGCAQVFYNVDEDYCLVDEVLFNKNGTMLIDFRLGENLYVIPDSIKSIEQKAFKEANRLHTVILPEGLKNIGASAFNGASNLTNIYIPASVSTIDTYTFYGTNLTDVYFGGTQEQWNAITIGNNNTNLKNANVHYNSELVIEDGVVYNSDKTVLICYDKTDKIFIVPATVKTIGARAFNDDKNLQQIVLPSGLEEIAYGAFYNCKSLSEIVIPGSVTIIEDSAFYGCSDLYKIELGEGITTINNSVFKNCTALTDIVFSDSLEVISSNAFYGCTAIGNLKLPEKLKIIGDGAFDGCTALATLNFPESLTSIGASVFANCTALTYISLPDSISSMGSAVFKNCLNLEKICLSEGNLAKIPANAFNGCGKLTDIYVSSNITEFGDSVFLGCNQLSYIYFGGTETQWDNISIVSSNSVIWAANVQFNHKHSFDEWTVDIPAQQCIDGYESSICTVCNYKERRIIPCTHNMIQIDAQIPTCAEIGWNDYEMCKDCDYTTYIVIPATGNHDYISVITTPATCKQAGVRTYTCTVCSDSYTEPVEIDSTNHVGGTEIRGAYAEDCGNNGYTGDIYCLGCDTKLADGTSIPATGNHDYTSAITTPATCNQAGVRTYTCTVCSDSYTEPVEIDSTNHVGGTEIRDAVTGNCGNRGYTGDTYCLGCNKKVSDGSVVPATGKHNYTSAVTTVATCKTTGIRTCTCTVCKDTYTETIAKDNKNHAGGTEIRNKKSATCTSEGHTGDTYCVGCNTKIANDSVIAATGHSKGDWEVVTEAQIGAEGKEVQKCLVCGEVVAERVIPAIPEVTYTVGDANGDGRVNAIDARIILRISAQLDSMENYNQPIAVFDLTGDGKVNAIDARKALRIGAQLE